MRMLDLFCGRFGWGKAFAARGWTVVGIDLVEPPEIPEGCTFLKMDVLARSHVYASSFDFICASPPCENFSVHCLPWFIGKAPHPEAGLRLFNHTRQICEASGVPYVIENVRCAQQFVGKASNRCGSFYLWGNAVPPLLPQGIVKGMQLRGDVKGWENMTLAERREARKTEFMVEYKSGPRQKKECTAKAATIPPELAACVADYAERMIEIAV